MHFDQAPGNSRFKKKIDQMDLDFEGEADNSAAEESERAKIAQQYAIADPSKLEKNANGEWTIFNMSLKEWAEINDMPYDTNPDGPGWGKGH